MEVALRVDTPGVAVEQLPSLASELVLGKEYSCLALRRPSPRLEEQADRSCK
jgi:hypothetical protein